MNNQMSNHLSKTLKIASFSAIVSSAMSVMFGLSLAKTPTVDTASKDSMGGAA